MALQAITANRLIDGAVVYLSADGAWVPSIASAALAEGEDAAASLAAAGERAVAERVVVAPYLIELERGPDGIRPTRYREQLRALGPSVPFGRPAAV
jgi:hypothetical protein